MDRLNVPYVFHINAQAAYQEQIRPEKPVHQKVITRRRIEELEEGKRINQEYAL